MNKKRMLKATLIYLLLPIVTYGVFALIVYLVNGNVFLKDSIIFNNYIREVVYMGLLALAVSLSVPNGRFDFSVGSIMILSIIVSSNIAYQNDLGAFGVLWLSILCGAVLGAISGLLYVLLRLPAMVTSIGVMLIFEAMTQILFDGKGFNQYTEFGNLYSYMGNIGIAITIFLIAVIMRFVLYRYTKLGYNIRSIRGGQRIAVDAGINERATAIACYIISGVLIAIAGINYGYTHVGQVLPVSSMSTIGIMFQGFLAMMIGELLERWGDFVLGIFVGSLVSAMITSFLSAISLDLTQIGLVNSAILLLFLIFNQYFDRLVKAIKKQFHTRPKEVEAS